MYNPKLHHRKSIRIKKYDYTNPNWYYITICTKDKQHYLGEIKNGKMLLNKYGRIVEEEWSKTKQLRENIDLDYYVIMPNHFHGIIIIESTAGATHRVPTPKVELKANSLGAIIGQFKSVVTKRIRASGLENFQWQRNYYEHIIRNEKDLFNIRQYIELNPLKWEFDDYY